MHDSVKSAWETFSRPLEGRLYSMYVDVKNLVTTGVGNLIDPVGAALQLPWKHGPTGPRATQAEISAAWVALKIHPGLAVKAGGPLVPLPKLGAGVAARLNDLRLTDADVDALVASRLAANEVVLRKVLPDWDNLPADAQLAILSMSWACGAGFMQTFTNFKRLALEGQWGAVIAKDASGGYAAKIREAGNPGIVPRNAKNVLCFANAAAVVGHGLDVSELHWPNPVPSAGEATEAHAEMQTALDAWTSSEYAKLRDIGPSAARDALNDEAAP